MNTKSWFYSKTIWINIIITLIGIITVIEAQYPTLGILIVVTGALNVILRTLTTTAIGSSVQTPTTNQ